MQEIAAKFTHHLKEALAKSLAFAVESKQNTVSPIHLLWALSLDPECVSAKILHQAGVTREKLDRFIAQQGMRPQQPLAIPNLAEDTKDIIEKAVITANLHNHQYISTEHLLSGILQVHSDEIIRFFTQEQIDTHAVQNQVKQTLNMTIQVPLDQPKELLEMDDQESEEQESAIEYFTQELTDEGHVKQQTPIIGRALEMKRLSTILGRKTKNNPILIGDPGVGKSAIVEGLAQQISQKKHATLNGHKIYALNLASLLAGTMYRGSFEARLQQLIDELKDDPKSILFIDEIHTIVGSGSNAGSLDAANMLKPALARGEIRCIGATTHEEYKKWIESDGALERRFARVIVDEPSKDETRAILQGIRSSYGTHHRVRFSDQVIDLVLELSDTHFPDQRFPDKAVDLLDEIGSYASQKERRVKTISQALVIEALSEMTGLSKHTLEQKKSQQLQRLAKTLKRSIFGQDNVIDTVTHTLQRAHLGLSDEKKPLASFLFVGSSGVGKTELAKQIAKAFFNGPRPLLRLDMSEYKEAFHASKLLGSPAGYVGYKDTNVLADHIRNYPHSVILFDEIEKAHPDILNLLLQILEEGVVRDATGRELTFSHAVLILTSNAGQDLFAKGSLGFGSEQTIQTAELRSKLEELLRPELLNRLDVTCRFNQLGDQALKQIAKHHVDQLMARLHKRGITCSYSPKIINVIIDSAPKKHGARGIHQYIAQTLEPLLIKELLTSRQTKELVIDSTKKAPLFLKNKPAS